MTSGYLPCQHTHELFISPSLHWQHSKKSDLPVKSKISPFHSPQSWCLFSRVRRLRTIVTRHLPWMVIVTRATVFGSTCRNRKGYLEIQAKCVNKIWCKRGNTWSFWCKDWYRFCPHIHTIHDTVIFYWLKLKNLSFSVSDRLYILSLKWVIATTINGFER